MADEVINLDDIRMSQVEEALKALLDLDTVRDVASVEISPRVVRCTRFARDENGHMFLDDQTKDAAKHILVRKVVAG